MFMSQFYNPSKHKKTSPFVLFSGGLEMEHWRNIDKVKTTQRN